jgi:hypothetical protein
MLRLAEKNVSRLFLFSAHDDERYKETIKLIQIEKTELLMLIFPLYCSFCFGFLNVGGIKLKIEVSLPGSGLQAVLRIRIPGPNIFGRIQIRIRTFGTGSRSWP